MASIGGLASKICDCGEPKARGAEACVRCGYLDGERPRRAQLIASLRNLSGSATLRAIQMEMGLHIRKCSEALAEAIADGQVERIVTESEYHKNEVVFQLVESIPARILVGEQTTLPRLERFMERAEPVPRAPKPEAKPRPAGWSQAIWHLVAMRARRPPKAPEVCCEVVDEQAQARCCEIVWNGRMAEHRAERHGAEPPAPPRVPDVLPGQLELC